MKESYRHGMGFTPEERDRVRAESGGKCMFPGEECSLPAEPFVPHLTGVFEAFLSQRLIGIIPTVHDDKASVRNPGENALPQCKKHNAFHDAQERYQIQCLRNEIWRARGGTLYERRRRKT